jgi:uncharacterized protein GlcG (DUF336 family)
MQRIHVAGVVLLLASAFASAHAQQATFETRSLTPESALTAARAAVEHCRKLGYQVAVAVVDRTGLPQVFLRDRFAGPHTVDIALNKAWTAATFKVPTATLAIETQAGKPLSGLRGHARVIAVAGGQIIEAAGSLLGAIGVSGAPGGEADDTCALAGIKAISDALNF